MYLEVHLVFGVLVEDFSFQQICWSKGGKAYQLRYFCYLVS